MTPPPEQAELSSVANFYALQLPSCTGDAMKLETYLGILGDHRKGRERERKSEREREREREIYIYIYRDYKL